MTNSLLGVGSDSLLNSYQYHKLKQDVTALEEAFKEEYGIEWDEDVPTRPVQLYRGYQEQLEPGATRPIQVIAYYTLEDADKDPTIHLESKSKISGGRIVKSPIPVAGKTRQVPTIDADMGELEKDQKIIQNYRSKIDERNRSPSYLMRYAMADTVISPYIDKVDLSSMRDHIAYAIHLQSLGVKNTSQMVAGFAYDINNVLFKSSIEVLSTGELDAIETRISKIIRQVNPTIDEEMIKQQFINSMSDLEGGTFDRLGDITEDQGVRMIRSLAITNYSLNLSYEAAVYGQYDVVRILGADIGRLNPGIGKYMDNHFGFLDKHIGLERLSDGWNMNTDEIQNRFMGALAPRPDGNGGLTEDLRNDASILRTGMSIGYGLNRPGLNKGRLAFFDTVERDVGIHSSTFREALGNGMHALGGHVPPDSTMGPHSQGPEYIPTYSEINRAAVGAALKIVGITLTIAAKKAHYLVKGEFHEATKATVEGIADAIKEGKRSNAWTSRQRKRRASLDKHFSEAGEREEYVTQTDGDLEDPLRGMEQVIEGQVPESESVTIPLRPPEPEKPESQPEPEEDKEDNDLPDIDREDLGCEVPPDMYTPPHRVRYYPAR
jgi:hypothetical protein